MFETKTRFPQNYIDYRIRFKIYFPTFTYTNNIYDLRDINYGFIECKSNYLPSLH